MIFISHGNGIESRLETERINAIILEDSEQYTGLIQKLWNQIHKHYCCMERKMNY